jgi:hypothetical protein
MNSVPDESLPLGDPWLIEHPTPNGVIHCSVILIAIVHVFGHNFPWRFGAIWPKLIESQINRNG